MAFQPFFMLWMNSRQAWKNNGGAKDTCKWFSNGCISVIYGNGFMPKTKFPRLVHITKIIISAGQELIQSFYSSIQKSHLISSKHWGALVSRASSANCSHLVVALPRLLAATSLPNRQHQIVQRALQLSLYFNTPFLTPYM